MERNRRDYPWRRSHRRLLLIVFGFAGLVALALAVLSWREESTLQQQVAAIRAKGEPITPDDLEKRWPAPPREENAADSYGKAGESLKAVLADKDYRAQTDKIFATPPKDHFAEELHQWMENHLKEHAEALRLLHEAAGKPALRYNMELGRGFEAPLPNLMEIRGSAQLLRMEACLAAEDGDGARAADAILAALAMDRPMRTAPVLIMQMIRLSCRSMACATIKRVLPMAGFSGEQLARLQPALAETDDPGALTNALIGERAMGLVAFDNPRQIIPQLQEADRWLPGASSFAAGFVRMSMAASGDRERYLRFMTRMVDASRLPTYEALSLLETMRGDLSSERSFLPGFTDQIIPNMSRCENQFARCNTDLCCAGAALAVERYRLANGTAPETAAALVPAFLPSLPLDPFDGQPLRYLTDGQGYAFYGVGENLRDDNGKDDPPGGEGDIVFRVVNPG